jgi:hypothetical protein
MGRRHKGNYYTNTSSSDFERHDTGYGEHWNKHWNKNRGLGKHNYSGPVFSSPLVGGYGNASYGNMGYGYPSSEQNLGTTSYSYQVPRYSSNAYTTSSYAQPMQGYGYNTSYAQPMNYGTSYYNQGYSGRYGNEGYTGYRNY